MTDYDAGYYASRRMSKDNPTHIPRTVKKIESVAEIARGARVLEVGCGLGRLTRALARRVTAIHGIDLSDDAIGAARRETEAANAVYEVADALSWTSRSEFDLVLALAVFEHFDASEQSSFLGRARGWLAPGGRLVLHVPIADSWSGKRRRSRSNLPGPDYTGDPTHKAVFSPASLREALTGRGWRIEKEWVRYARWGWPAPLAKAAQAAMPRRVKEKFAMEMMVAATPPAEA